MMRRITDEEIDFFHANGYVICRSVFHADEMTNVREETTRLIEEILTGGPAKDWSVEGPEGVPFELEYLHMHPNTFSMRLLAHPFIGDLLTRIVGPDFIPSYETLVFKLKNNGSSVPWHRDSMVTNDDDPLFQIDIYPDKSTIENSCVWVIPKSHRWEKDEAIEWMEREKKEWRARGKTDFGVPGAIPAEVEPGDVMLHNSKVIHGSPENKSGKQRRVVYFDNRSVSLNEKYEWWPHELMEKRCLLYQAALHERRTNPYPSDDECFDYSLPDGLPAWAPGAPVDLHCSRD